MTEVIWNSKYDISIMGMGIDEVLLLREILAGEANNLPNPPAMLTLIIETCDDILKIDGA